jgi:cytoskeletal protein CcmA (bactofilin family)
MLSRSTASRDQTTPEREKLGSLSTLLAVTGPAAKLEGKFDIAESVQIECEVGGELSVGESLVVGQKGVVTADVWTVDAVIHGSYTGTLVATGTVEIAATGHVTGNIETDSLVISKGGFFNGSVIRANGRRDARAAGGVAEEPRAIAQM